MLQTRPKIDGGRQLIADSINLSYYSVAVKKKIYSRNRTTGKERITRLYGHRAKKRGIINSCPFVYTAPTPAYVRTAVGRAIDPRSDPYRAGCVRVMAPAQRAVKVQCPPMYIHKWKNHFYEMKGDVGMSLREKERNKMMPIPRHKVTHNPISTSFLCCLFVCYECIRQSKQHNILTSNCLHENVRCSLGRNKDVGMGI